MIIRIAKASYFIVFVFIFLTIAVGWFPQLPILVLIEYCLLFSPRWIWIIFLLGSVPGWKSYNRTTRLVFVFCVLFVVWFQDLNWPFKLPPKSTEGYSISLLSVNVGNNTNHWDLAGIVATHKPQIVVMQESSKLFVNKAFDNNWMTHCQSNLCIASKYKFSLKKTFPRKIFGGWGDFLAVYNIELSNGRDIALMNVHFETPRPVLSDLINWKVDLEKIEKIQDNRLLQTSVLEAALRNENSFIVAGDFNMTVNERAYKQYLSGITNALSKSTQIMNYTKFTSLHGIRIDHVLASNNINVLDATALAPLGGDHGAVLTQLAFSE